MMQTELVDHGLWVPSFLGRIVNWAYEPDFFGCHGRSPSSEWREWAHTLLGLGADRAGQLRSPRFNLECHQPGNLSWHQDDGGASYIMFTWANILPTEVRGLFDLMEIKLKPGHIYSFPNHLFEHRTPKEAQGNTERWFARGYLDGKVRCLFDL